MNKNFSNYRLTFDSLLNVSSIGESGRRSLIALKEELESDKFEFLRELKRRFGTGIEICVTGGAVRDAVMGVPPKDIDLIMAFSGFGSHEEAQTAFEAFFGVREYKKAATGALKSDEWHIYSKRWGKLVLAGEKFGVYKLYLKGHDEIIDIAFPRTETAVSGDLRGGRNAFDVQSNALLPIEDDLARRDFTFNSMCLAVDYDLKSRNMARPPAALTFIDLFSGLADCLENKIIRTTGAPEVTFGDDLSRIFRAVRFSCRFGFNIEETAWSAISSLAGDINKKNLDGKFVLKRETLSAEVLKSFCIDPLKAFDLMTRPLTGKTACASCLLELIFPDLFNEIRFSGPDKSYILPKNGGRKWYDDIFGSEIPDGDELASSRAIKICALERVRRMFELARDYAIKLSADEIFAILFHDAGETKKLERAQPQKKRCVYDNSHLISSMIWTRSFSNLKMCSLPAGNEKFAVNKNEVVRLIQGIYSIYPRLGDNFDRSHIHGHEHEVKNINFITRILKNAANDSLLKILRLDAHASDTVSETTRVRAGNLIEFARIWFDRVEKMEKAAASVTAPGNITGAGIKFSSVFSTKIISGTFMIREGPVYSEFERIAYAAFIVYLHGVIRRKNLLDAAADEASGSVCVSPRVHFDANDAKKYIFYELVVYSPFRKELEALITPGLISFLAEGECGSSESRRVKDSDDARRELLYVIERSAYYGYTGLPFSGLPSKGKRPRWNAPAPTEKRGAVFTKNFMDMMIDDPLGLMEVIERHFTPPDARRKRGGGFFDVVLPGLTAMIGVEQPAKYHSEGDVWEHTKKCVRHATRIVAERNLNESDRAALIMAALFHDAGKPAARSIGDKGQICFYGHEELSAKEFEKFAAAFDLHSAAGTSFTVNFVRARRAIRDHSTAAQ
nr:HD domain-containing protein [Candidatus Wallbacteria bacterium]